jgi:hypothetical protein
MSSKLLVILSNSHLAALKKNGVSYWRSLPVTRPYLPRQGLAAWGDRSMCLANGGSVAIEWKHRTVQRLLVFAHICRGILSLCVLVIIMPEAVLVDGRLLF